MYKNQLQELAQRSCFNLPSYSCIREGPDHGPRFKATVNFNGETFESPHYCSTLRQAEHSAAEVALNALANRGPSNSLAARILDETGVYKNLLQEVSQRVGASLPAYTTFRSGLGHLPVFTGTVELAGVIFSGEPAKNKKQAEKNAAMAAWSSLKLLAQQSESSTPDKGRNDEQEHVTVARALQKFLIKAKLARVPFPINFSSPNPRPSSTHQITTTTSKILPLICPRTASRSRPVSPVCLRTTAQSRHMNAALNEASFSSRTAQPEMFPAASAAPYIPVRHFSPHHRIAPPVTIRNAIPVFSAPPIPPPSQSPRVIRPATLGVAPSVSIRHVVPVYAAPPPPVRAEELPVVDRQPQQKQPPSSKAPPVCNEALNPKAPEIQVHHQPSKPASGRADEPSLSRTSQIQLEAPPSHQVLPKKVEEPILSETLPPQVDSQLPKISTDLEPAPCQSNEQTAVMDKPQESLEIENFKQLKI
ncbi:PREDICTED: double-stranded RNA-binding protein 2-like isoform X1 [Ipomoea nil]|uniref:double-stranded RNA-binding protein 2-like isoform X1 n=1 Tax=Ipomoea nil TaxID=35883 RepID=UPI000901E996|nr:PREDICTED: double-stranded RNA-binding protein 2-like isoform X1 [Ipomoea nil]